MFFVTLLTIYFQLNIKTFCFFPIQDDAKVNQILDGTLQISDTQSEEVKGHFFCIYPHLTLWSASSSFAQTTIVSSFLHPLQSSSRPLSWKL